MANHRLRLQCFFILFGVGILAHEMQLITRQFHRVRDFLTYSERWERVFAIPNIFSPELTFLIHLAIVILSVSLIVGKQQKLIATILFIIIIPSLLIIPPPNGIPNHYIVIFFVLLAHTSFVFVQAFATAKNGEGLDISVSQIIDGGFCTAAKHIFCISYFFAFFHKLNTGWFSAETTPATDFLLPYFAPLLSVFNGTDVFNSLVVEFTIYSALAVEFSLPILLLFRPTRILGCFTAVIFNVLIMGRGVYDYPAVILAFLPLFFEEDELQTILSTQIPMAMLSKLCVSFAFGTYIYMQAHWTLWRDLRLLLLNPGAFPAMSLTDSLFAYVLTIAWTYVGCSLAMELLQVSVSGIPVRVQTS